MTAHLESGLEELLIVINATKAPIILKARIAFLTYFERREHLVGLKSVSPSITILEVSFCKFFNQFLVLKMLSNSILVN